VPGERTCRVGFELRRAFLIPQSLHWLPTPPQPGPCDGPRTMPRPLHPAGPDRPLQLSATQTSFQPSTCHRDRPQCPRGPIRARVLVAASPPLPSSQLNPHLSSPPSSSSSSPPLAPPLGPSPGAPSGASSTLASRTASRSTEYEPSRYSSANCQSGTSATAKPPASASACRQGRACTPLRPGDRDSTSLSVCLPFAESLGTAPSCVCACVRACVCVCGGDRLHAGARMRAYVCDKVNLRKKCEYVQN
jgi:hypothetical protein